MKTATTCWSGSGLCWCACCGRKRSYAAHSGVSLGLVALAIVWSLVIGVLGITRNRLLPGDAALGGLRYYTH